MIKSTFSILFLIRKSRLGKSGESPISMRITVNGRFTEMSTLRKVPANLWGSKKSEPLVKALSRLRLTVILNRCEHEHTRYTKSWSSAMAMPTR